MCNFILFSRQVKIRFNNLPVKRKIHPLTIILTSFVLFSNFLTLAKPCQAAFEGISPHTVGFLFWSDFFYLSNNAASIKLEREWRYNLPELAINRLNLITTHRKYIGTAGWISSGDEIYRENRLVLGGGLTRRSMLLLLTGNIYHLTIKNYGSSTTSGVGLIMGYKLHSDVICAAGIDGLITGRIRRGHDDIERKTWGSVVYIISEETKILGLVQAGRYDSVSLSLGIRSKLNPWIQSGILFTDHPERLGVMIDLFVNNITISMEVTNQPPLGWTQRIGLRFDWK